MRSFAWFVLFGAACGSVDENRHLDGGGIDSTPTDATDAAIVPTCYGATFGTPSPVGVINSGADEVLLRMSQDELTAYFTRLGSAGPSATFIATRASMTSPFGAPTALSITGNAGAEVISPTVTADGLTLYFSSSRTGTSGMEDIWKATRATTTADFGTIVNVSELNSTATEDDVYVVPDGSAIYFSTTRNAAVYSIFRAQKTGANFGAPVEVLSVSPTFVNHVVVSPDELTMFYQVGNDIRESRRASKSDPFTVSPNPIITSPNADKPDWISPDGCRLYFETNRAGTAGLDLWVAVRTPQ